MAYLKKLKELEDRDESLQRETSETISEMVSREFRLDLLLETTRIRHKQKYFSYQEEIDKKLENLIEHQFEASNPMAKCYTDVT